MANNYKAFLFPFRCWSQVGRIGNQQNISITARCASMGVVIHEIGHAVGFYHQHARRDRDRYISVLNRNILPMNSGQFGKISNIKFSSSLFCPQDIQSSGMTPEDG